MGGGGFAQHAKNVTENNRALLRSKKRSRKTKENVYGKASVTKLVFKKSTQADVLKVRGEMKAYNCKLLIKSFIAFGILLLGIVSLWIFLG